MTSLAVVLVILIAIVQFMTTADQAWKSSAVDPFTEAQDAFETIAQTVTTATLEPYRDYADAQGNFRSATATTSFTPDHLARRSDLDFVCGPSAGDNGLLKSSGRTTTGCSLFFAAPQGYTQTDARTGMEHLLNAIGYFLEFGDDDTAPTFVVPLSHAWRWRLKQIVQPSENLQIYAASATPGAWIQQAVANGAPNAVLADNIITLVVLPERSAQDTDTPLAADFRYDSRDPGNAVTVGQLPPRVRVALVAIDEPSALLLAARYGTTPPPLVPADLFTQAEKLDADLATLDAALTAQKISHRLFQREISLNAAAWTATP